MVTDQRAALRERVDKALAVFLADRRAWMAAVDPALAPLADAVEAFVLRGGKRLRPAFAYWGYRGAGGADTDAVIAAISSLELVQASALMHDDIIDRSDTRRGEPAMHRRFAAQHRALRWRRRRRRVRRRRRDPARRPVPGLVRRACCTRAASTRRRVARARPVFDEMRTEVTVGQYLDVHSPGHRRHTRSSARARSPATSRRSTQSSVRCCSARRSPTRPPSVRAAYSGYGLPLGEAFQLRDDVLGVFGDPAQTGKPAGDDLREGKRTFLVAAAYETTGDHGREVLDRLLGDPALDPAGVAALREVIVASGAAARTERRIDALTTAALEALDGAPLDPEAARVLHDLADAATRRTD